jgi:hypothetical protein
VADKLTPLILDALTRAAAAPAGVPLFGSRSDPGLFPATAAGRTAAARAMADGHLQVVRTEQRGRQTRELAAVTPAGLVFLSEHASPNQVLGDFLRALEQREAEMALLLSSADRMAGSLAGLKEAVSLVLDRLQPVRSPAVAESIPSRPVAHPALTATHHPGVSSMNGVATLELGPAVETQDDLSAAVLARLADWSASAVAGQDCPLPELYRSLSTREVPPSIGTFHDSLRELVAERRIYLHPWTGPLYALPEPAYALLVGHNVAYYASARGSN